MRSVVLLILPVAIAMAGCGGGSTDSTTTQADYVALADVICKNHQSRTEDLESQTVDLGPLDSKEKAHRVAGLLRQQDDNLSAEARELGAMKPPPAAISAVSSILGLLRTKAELTGQWAKAYDDLDTAQIRGLQVRIGIATIRARKAAQAYGFEVCGQG